MLPLLRTVTSVSKLCAAEPTTPVAKYVILVPLAVATIKLPSARLNPVIAELKLVMLIACPAVMPWAMVVLIVIVLLMLLELSYDVNCKVVTEYNRSSLVIKIDFFVVRQPYHK
jgi:hypothetical protein